VARLILLNGSPGCGKSTLAQRFVDEHPLSLNLDIDRIRAQIGGWQREPHAAGLLARGIALAAARAHLVGGHDVVIPQYLGRTEFIEQLAALACEVRAEFFEIVLLDTKANSMRRFQARSLAALDQVHLDAQQLVDRNGGAEALSVMYDRLLAVLASRPSAKVVTTRDGEVDEAYRGMLAQLS
jgi:predicted kinase